MTLTKKEIRTSNIEVKEKSALCIKKLMRIIENHHTGKEESEDILEDIMNVLDEYDLHMDDFINTLNETPTVKSKIADVLKLHKHDSGLYNKSKQKDVFSKIF